MMKVYCVFRIDEDDEKVLEGIFKSKEAAEKYKWMGEFNTFDVLVIEEWEVKS